MYTEDWKMRMNDPIKGEKTMPTFTKQSDGARICNVCKVQGEFVNCDVCGGDGIAGMDENTQPVQCDACAGDGGKWVCPNCKE